MVYSAGYLVLIVAFLLGQLGGLVGLGAIITATGILMAMVFGPGLAKVLEGAVGVI